MAGCNRRLELEAPATRALSPAAWPESDAPSASHRPCRRHAAADRAFHRRPAAPRARDRTARRHGDGLDRRGRRWTSWARPLVRSASSRSSCVTAIQARSPSLPGPSRGRTLPGRRGTSKLAMAADLVEKAARVAPDDHWADAARKMLHRHVVRMLEREGATRAGDVLALKQMRVATRRMRAHVACLRRCLLGRPCRALSTQGLRRVAGCSGR